MREIKAQDITNAVAELCMSISYQMGEDVTSALRKAAGEEKSPLGREVLEALLENTQIAKADKIPLCQDCGTAVVFAEIGQDAHVTDGFLEDAINEGVKQGYEEGYLRKSMVKKPFTERKNTCDNTPAIIHTEIVKGDRVKISVLAKGSGSENMSALAMLKPAEGRQGIIDFVAKTVENAGGNPCPPLVIGLGIGGNAEKAMIMAKKSLLRTLGKPSDDKEIAELEQEILEKVNALGIGPLGFGGSVTALAVHTISMPCHIASLPVAVNLQCHSTRHGEVIL